MVPQLVPRGRYDARLLDGPLYPRRPRQVEGHRLLDEKVQASLDGRDLVIGPGERRNEQKDAVEIGRVEHLVVVGEYGAAGSKRFGRRLGPLRGDVADCYDLGFGAIGKCFEMASRDRSGTGHADSYRHVRFSSPSAGLGGLAVGRGRLAD